MIRGLNHSKVFALSINCMQNTHISCEIVSSFWGLALIPSRSIGKLLGSTGGKAPDPRKGLRSRACYDHSIPALVVAHLSHGVLWRAYITCMQWWWMMTLLHMNMGILTVWNVKPSVSQYETWHGWLSYQNLQLCARLMASNLFFRSHQFCSSF